MIPVIGSKQKGHGMIPVIVYKWNERVPVTGNAKTKWMIPVIGSKQNGHGMIPVIGIQTKG